VTPLLENHIYFIKLAKKNPLVLVKEPRQPGKQLCGVGKGVSYGRLGRVRQEQVITVRCVYKGKSL
jgi:hypothetical protein